MRDAIPGAAYGVASFFLRLQRDRSSRRLFPSPFAVGLLMVVNPWSDSLRVAGFPFLVYDSVLLSLLFAFVKRSVPSFRKKITNKITKKTFSIKENCSVIFISICCTVACTYIRPKRHINQSFHHPELPLPWRQCLFRYIYILLNEVLAALGKRFLGTLPRGFGFS